MILNKIKLPHYIFLNDIVPIYCDLSLLNTEIKPKFNSWWITAIFTYFKKKIKLKKTKKKKIIFFVSEKLPKKFENQKIIFIKKNITTVTN